MLSWTAMCLGPEDTTLKEQLKKKQLKIVPALMELPFENNFLLTGQRMSVAFGIVL